MHKYRWFGGAAHTHRHTHSDWDCEILIVGVGAVCAWFRTAFFVHTTKTQNDFICSKYVKTFIHNVCVCVCMWRVLPDLPSIHSILLDMCVSWILFHFKYIIILHFSLLQSLFLSFFVLSIIYLLHAIFLRKWFYTKVILHTGPPMKRMMREKKIRKIVIAESWYKGVIFVSFAFDLI